MTSNEEIYRLMTRYRKICNPPLWLDMEMRDENAADYREEAENVTERN